MVKKVGDMKKCNQQWKQPKHVMKTSGKKMKTNKKIVMKNPNWFSCKKWSFSLVAKKFHFPKSKNLFQGDFFLFF